MENVVIVTDYFTEGRETRMKGGDQGNPGASRRARRPFFKSQTSGDRSGPINRAFNLTTTMAPGSQMSLKVV